MNPIKRILSLPGVALTALSLACSASAAPSTTAQSASPGVTSGSASGEVVLNETCPVMGGPVNSAVAIEYQGKTVLFCCAGCPEQFLADPERYLSQLPQFSAAESQSAHSHDAGEVPSHRDHQN